MKIPQIYPISSSKGNTEEFLKALKLLKSFKLNTFQYRRKNLNQKEVEKELKSIQKVCQQESINFIVNSFHFKKPTNRFQGIHLTSHDLNKQSVRPIEANKVLGASCHNKEDILKAESINVDYIFLSPIKKTGSHNHANEMGWELFKSLTKDTQLKVLALGGLGRQDLLTAQKYGAHGIAGITQLWCS